MGNITETEMDRSFLGIGGRRAGGRTSGRSASEVEDVEDDDRHEIPIIHERSDHIEVRLWLRLLHCTRAMEQNLRNRLRKEFNISLARFDLMAQLERFPNGLRMSELSKYLMVTNGTSTGLVAGLVEEGMVERDFDENDRRTVTIRLTDAGKTQFLRMAQRHEEWVISKLGELSREAKRDLLENLVLLDRHVSHA